MSKQQKESHVRDAVHMYLMNWSAGLTIYTQGLEDTEHGIDCHDQLKLFDFGAIRHRTEESFHVQVVRDHFILATCIHFLASVIDPLAKMHLGYISDMRPYFSYMNRGSYSMYAVR
jgi:hypothetical protein